MSCFSRNGCPQIALSSKAHNYDTPLSPNHEKLSSAYFRHVCHFVLSETRATCEISSYLYLYIANIIFVVPLATSHNLQDAMISDKTQLYHQHVTCSVCGAGDSGICDSSGNVQFVESWITMYKYSQKVYALITDNSFLRLDSRHILKIIISTRFGAAVSQCVFMPPDGRNIHHILVGLA